MKLAILTLLIAIAISANSCLVDNKLTFTGEICADLSKALIEDYNPSKKIYSHNSELSMTYHLAAEYTSFKTEEISNGQFKLNGKTQPYFKPKLIHKEDEKTILFEYSESQAEEAPTKCILFKFNDSICLRILDSLLSAASTVPTASAVLTPNSLKVYDNVVILDECILDLNNLVLTTTNGAYEFGTIQVIETPLKGHISLYYGQVSYVFTVPRGETLNKLKDSVYNQICNSNRIYLTNYKNDALLRLNKNLYVDAQSHRVVLNDGLGEYELFKLMTATLNENITQGNIGELTLLLKNKPMTFNFYVNPSTKSKCAAVVKNINHVINQTTSCKISYQSKTEGKTTPDTLEIRLGMIHLTQNGKSKYQPYEGFIEEGDKVKICASYNKGADFKKGCSGYEEFKLPSSAICADKVIRELKENSLCNLEARTFKYYNGDGRYFGFLKFTLAVIEVYDVNGKLINKFKKYDLSVKQNPPRFEVENDQNKVTFVIPETVSVENHICYQAFFGEKPDKKKVIRKTHKFK
jgi:hypothetical protein